MTFWNWFEVAWLGGLSLVVAIVIAVQKTIGLIGDRTRERVTDLEAGMTDLNDRLKCVECPVCRERQGKAAKDGFPSEFARRASKLHRGNR